MIVLVRCLTEERQSDAAFSRRSVNGVIAGARSRRRSEPQKLQVPLWPVLLLRIVVPPGVTLTVHADDTQTPANPWGPLFKDLETLRKITPAEQNEFLQKRFDQFVHVGYLSRKFGTATSYMTDDM